MSEFAILAVAVATAVLLYAVCWYAVRNLPRVLKVSTRVILVALFFGPMAWVRFGETVHANKVPPPRKDGHDATHPAPPQPTAPTSSPPASSAQKDRAGADQTTPPQATPVAAPGSSELWHVVRVFYGTDRARGVDNTRLTYSSDRAGRLEVGYADITVPKAHQVPNIERPFAVRLPFTSVTLVEMNEDPTKHFTLRALKAISQQAFIAEVREKLALSETFKDRAVVFIHGYNTEFEFALYRTAQVAYDLKFDGAAFLYSWPSGSGVAGYVYDRDSAELAEPHLAAFLDLVIRQTGAKQVSLIAHSMGNLPLLRVLRDIAPKLPEGVKVDQVILAAPDVDRMLFEQLAANIADAGRGVTLYASSRDKAMVASRLLTGAPRAGDVPASGPIVMAGIDTIDISSTTMDSLALGHSLYAERNTLLRDIAALLQTGLRPPDKRMSALVRVETPKGAYWRVP